MIYGGIAQQETLPGQLTVTTDSEFTLIHWDQFNIREGERTHFELPHALAAVVNRDTAGLPSHILGELSCNGSMVILNPLGIHVGEVGSITANHLLASALDTDESTMFTRKGQQLFKGGDGVIDNKGVITSRCGHVVLLGNSVSNSGFICARGGNVVIGAAPEITFFKEGTPAITVRADLSKDSKVVSSGDIFGNNIEVLTCTNPFTCAINLSGTMATEEVTDDLGSIRITAGGNIAFDGYVHGHLDVAAQDVLVTENAQLDASHSTNPGNIDIISASKIYISDEASLTTAAKIKGDGGDINLIAEIATLHKGTCNSKGGPEGGHGGNIELSGKQCVALPGTIEREAQHPSYSPGRLILDPESDITLSRREDANYHLFDHTFTPTTDNMNVHLDALVHELSKGPVTITTTYPGPLAGKGSIILEEQAPLLYTSPYDLTLRCYSDKAITLNSPIHNSGSGNLHIECPNGSVAINAPLHSRGNMTIGTQLEPIGQTVTLTPTGSDLTLTCSGQGNLSIYASESVSIDSNAVGATLLSTEQGALTLASDQAILLTSLEDRPLQLTAGEGGLHLQNITQEGAPKVVIASQEGAITLDSLNGDISLKGVADVILEAYQDPTNITTTNGDLHIQSHGSLLAQTQQSPITLAIDGQIDADIKGDLLLHAEEGKALVYAKEEQLWTIRGNMLISSNQGTALFQGDKHAQLNIKEDLILYADTPLGAGIDNNEGLSLFVGEDLMMEGESFLGQEMDSLTASIGGSLQLGDEEASLCDCQITAGSIDISTGSRITLKGRSHISALHHGLQLTANAPITFFDNTNVMIQKGDLELKSLTGHIALYDQTQMQAVEGSVNMIAKSSIFLHDKTKVTSHGPHGINLVCDFGKTMGTGRFVLAKDAKVNSSHAPLNIFAASQAYNRIDGTLNNVSYTATPQFFSNTQEAWGVNFIDYEKPQPFNITPIIEEVPLLKLLELPAPAAFQVFYKEVSPIAVGTTLLTSAQLQPIVMNFAGPAMNELGRDLHDYDSFIWAETAFYTSMSEKLREDYPLLPIFHSCPLFSIHYLDRKSSYIRNLIENNL